MNHCEISIDGNLKMSEAMCRIANLPKCVFHKKEEEKKLFFNAYFFFKNKWHILFCF